MNKNIVQKAVERQFGKKKEALETLSLKLMIHPKEVNDFLDGKRPLNTEKLCELLSLLELPSRE